MTEKTVKIEEEIKLQAYYDKETIYYECFLKKWSEIALYEEFIISFISLVFVLFLFNKPVFIVNSLCFAIILLIKIKTLRLDKKLLGLLVQEKTETKEFKDLNKKLTLIGKCSFYLFSINLIFTIILQLLKVL